METGVRPVCPVAFQAAALEQARDFKASDALRAELTASGIVIENT